MMDREAKGRKRYVKWFNTYACSRFERGFKNFCGKDCYDLRCAILHEGKTKHKLVVATSEELFFSSGVFGREGEALVIDIKQFCENMVYAFYEWIEVKEDDPSFEFKSLKINDVAKGVWKFG